MSSLPGQRRHPKVGNTMTCGDQYRMPEGLVRSCELPEGHTGDHQCLVNFPNAQRRLFWPTKRQKMIDDVSDVLQRRDSR